MNTSISFNNDDNAFEDGLTREEILIGRVTDGEASPNDWAELQRLARQDAGVLERLAEAQRMHAALEQTVEDRIAICELIEARALHRESSGVLMRIGTLGGWAAAAALGVMWWTGMQQGPQSLQPNGSSNVAQHGPPAGTVGGEEGEAQTIPVFDNYDPDTVYSGYLRSGMKHDRVVGVMPDKFINYRANDDGTFEVLIVRQIVERRQVNRLNQLDLQADELGNPFLVKEPMPARGRRDAM